MPHRVRWILVLFASLGACRASDYGLENDKDGGDPTGTTAGTTTDTAPPSDTGDSGTEDSGGDTGCVPSDEICDELDNDCDGLVDEDLGLIWYRDADEDGHGDPDVSVEDCAQPSGYVATDDDCDDTEPRVPAEDGWCLPGRSCLDILEHGLSDGDGRYEIDPEGDGSTIEVRCDMSTDGGGWTLLVVAADDAQTTFTWARRDLWGSDDTEVGSLDETQADFKSPALHDVPVADLLTVHAPSGEWAAYDGVGDRSLSLADQLVALGAVCYGTAGGYAMTAGTIAVADQLCSTDLYLNAIDQDGQTTCASHDDGWGPGWGASNNASCPIDDIGHMGFGPNALYPDSEADTSFQGFGAGFGWGLGLNTGTLGAGENRIALWGR